MRTHLLQNDSGTVSATLLLRSNKIVHDDGLAHLTEHTSFCGAAGSLSARDVKERHKDLIQESNASTACGAIQWDVSFLPKYTADVLGLLALTSLDQKFDVETVGKQAQVVLEELYLEKYDAIEKQKQEFDISIYGKNHPYVKLTADAEIRKAKTPSDVLAAELRRYAASIRLPANMDLFLVGEFDPQAVERGVREHFGAFPFAEGPALDLPRVAVTHGYKRLTGTSREFEGPVSEVKIAWNTGVRLCDPEARVLAALRQYLDGALFDHLREEEGDTYTPEVTYDADECSGVFDISVKSSKNPAAIEKKMFDAIERLKSNIEQRELDRFRDQLEFKRRRDARANSTHIERMVERVRSGVSAGDLAVETVTREEMLAAARAYLPSHQGAYVRLALRGA